MTFSLSVGGSEVGQYLFAGLQSVSELFPSSSLPPRLTFYRYRFLPVCFQCLIPGLLEEKNNTLPTTIHSFPPKSRTFVAAFMSTAAVPVFNAQSHALVLSGTLLSHAGRQK